MSDPHEIGAVSLRDVAARVGCSHATVSRALRDQSRVSAETKAKIKKIAKEMGYKPNPMISSLMATQNRKLQRHTLKANIGWLNAHPEKNFWHMESYSTIFIEAAAKHAQELGYGFEELWVYEPGMTANRLNDIAIARGVQGFIVPGPVEFLNQDNFDWSSFSVACVREYQIGQHDWHRASVSLRKNAQLAYESMRKLGYRRIGYIASVSSMDPNAEDRVNAFNNGKGEGDDFILHRSIHSELAGYLYTQAFVKKEHRIPPFMCLLPATYTPREGYYIDSVSKWLKETKPEAVICADCLIADAAKKAGMRIPEDLAVAHMGLGADVEGWAGVETLRDKQAAAAVDLLCSQIENNERGIPRFSKQIHITGHWNDGWTAPGKNKS